ncbi:MarR family winged helix-turn-helix transcriptional regulator [Yinghuangia sp. YIM S10712]|uniref:MarR family winged helix-turn-helix transcriptional regulator n=1 Tax=Yinghuangia sp. YIM S10712 TaxID=3436930 RepID=UPI003F53722C
MPEQLPAEPPGFMLPLRLFMAFRGIIDEVHTELATQGHPDMRPSYGFVFQAIGPSGTTAAELARTLGVSKQAAGKTIATLKGLGYVELSPDPRDARRKLVNLTPHGVDCLVRSSRIFDAIRARWADELGPDRLRALDADLRRMAPDEFFRLDIPGWFGGAG